MVPTGVPLLVDDAGAAGAADDQAALGDVGEHGVARRVVEEGLLARIGGDHRGLGELRLLHGRVGVGGDGDGEARGQAGGDGQVANGFMSLSLSILGGGVGRGMCRPLDFTPGTSGSAGYPVGPSTSSTRCTRAVVDDRDGARIDGRAVQLGPGDPATDAARVGDQDLVGRPARRAR